MSLPASYEHWLDAAKRLLEPLAALMQPEKADLPIAGPASDHDAQADRLESFARPLLLAAHFLQAASRPSDAELRARLASWFRRGMAIGTDPGHPAYWGPDANYHQHHVEIGLLAIALQIAPDQLWQPFSREEKDRIAHWFGSARGNGIVHNNHYFMGVHILEFLGKHGYGRRTDRALIDTFLDRLESMHRGGGWFEDGINQAFDHYNAYAYHFYGLWWVRLHGARDPERAARWRAWARAFVADYEYFFAANGECPAFGRSLSYRFAGLNVFALSLLEGCCDAPPGRLRELCTRGLDFFLSRPIFQEQGCLSLGWTDRFEAIAEPYSCAASPYWAAKGFGTLLLPATHAFWTDPALPLLSEQSDHARAIRPAGLVVRHVGGAVEIINAGSQIANVMLRYGAWKWSKIAYRTGLGFTIGSPTPGEWSSDSALTIELTDGRIYGRHSTIAVEIDDQHTLYSYNLGFKTGQVNVGVETALWWRAGWLLSLHTYEARQDVAFRLGGFALPSDVADAFSLETKGLFLATWTSAGRGSVLQGLHGFHQGGWEKRLDEATPRTHLIAPYHVMPRLDTQPRAGSGQLAALSWAGSDPAEAKPWAIVSLAAGRWELRHGKLGSWTIEHWALPALPLPPATLSTQP
jgi:hypothetical protein